MGRNRRKGNKIMKNNKVKAPTNFDVVQSLNCIWEKLHSYRGFDNDECGVQEEEWDDICTAMSWIEDQCGVKRVEGILDNK